MPDKTKEQQDEEDFNDQLYYRTVASATEVTGMIPTQPTTEDEAENYEQLGNITHQTLNKDSKPQSSGDG